MLRFDLRTRLFASCLSGLAGFVDATAFVMLGGFFVSFMSGNTTRLGVGIATEGHHAAIAGGLIATFVGGVMLGSLLGRKAGGRRATFILGLMTLLLAAAACFSQAGLVWLSAGALALAMGAENAIFERDGDVQLGLTYMTGTLVKFGQRFAAALTGTRNTGWRAFLLLWLGLAAGACFGAIAWTSLGSLALWIACAWAACLAAISSRIKLS